MNDTEIYKKIAYKKVLFSLVIVGIYILGSNILIPGINIEGLYQNQTSLLSSNISLMFSMTGLSLNQMSLFSLGLGPWMSALIFWRVLAVTNLFNVKTLTNRQSYQIRFLFSLILAAFQSFTIISQAKIYDQSATISNWELGLILITGYSVLVWLGNLNTQMGIGGPTVIILVSILRDVPTKFINFLDIQGWQGIFFNILPGILVLLVGSYFVFRFYQGERRLQIKNVMMDESTSTNSYLPIPTNPAGGMPFMFAFSIVLLPQYLLYFIQERMNHVGWLKTLYKNVQLDQLFGVSLLILSIVLLTYGFSYVNIDYKEISDSLKKSGDYFSGVYPGKNTERFLFHKVTLMATIGAVVNGLIIGVPMLLSLYIPALSMWAYIIPTWLILMILMKEIKVQFSSLYHRNDYHPILED